MAVTSNFGKRPASIMEGDELITQIMGLLSDIDNDKLAQVAEIVLDKEVKVVSADEFSVREHLEMTVTTRVKP